MDRLEELLNNYTNQTMEIELVDLLIAELNNRATTIEFLGGQLKALKEIKNEKR
tara:strand:+ start:671 stop:832 length:162 start_codon:yes stop_codon:yes gene_type:complete